MVMEDSLRDLKEAHPTRLLGSDEKGLTWDVVIIREGLSKNGNNYRAEVLKAAAHLFENLRACAYRFGKSLNTNEDHFNHLPELPARNMPGGFIENVVGWFDQVHFGEFQETDGTTSNGLLAKFHVLPAAEWLRKNMLEAFSKGRSDLYEFSIDARGPAVPAIINGKQVRDVQEIKSVSSTDVVSDGAAGGQVLRLVAAVGMETASDLVKLIRECRPKWLQAFEPPADGVDLSEYAVLVLEHNLGEAEKLLRETPTHATQYLTEVVRGIKTLDSAIEMIRTGNVPEAMNLLRSWIAEFGEPEQGSQESQRRGLYSFPCKNHESGGPGSGGPKSNETIPPQAQESAQETPTVSTPATNPADAGTTASDSNGDAMKAKEQDLAKREAALRVKEATLNIEVALNGSELHEAAKIRLRSELIAVAESSELTVDAITERVKSEVAYLAEVGTKQETATPPVVAPVAVAVAAPVPVVVRPKNMGGAHNEPGTVAVGMTEADKWEKAWDGFFEGGKTIDGIAPVGSLHRAFGEMLGGRLGYVDREEMADYIFESIKLAVPASPRILPEKHFARLREGFQRMHATDELKEAIVTGDFPVAFGQALFRKLQKEYKADAHNDWRKVVSSFENLQDATNAFSIARLGGVATMPIVAQGAPYEEFNDPTENEEQLIPQKRGALLKFTWEDALADKIGVLRRIPRILGRSAARTIQQKVWDEIDLNPNTADAIALINASHNNLLSGAPVLGSGAVADAIELLQVMPEQDSSERLGLEARFLLVGPKKRSEAFELTRSETKVNSDEDATVKSMINALGIEMIATIGLGRVVSPTTAFRWYLMIDPADGETIVVGFLGGRDRPDIFVQSPMDTPTSGASFEADALTFKTRLVFNAKVADHRGIVGSLATS